MSVGWACLLVLVEHIELLYDQFQTLVRLLHGLLPRNGIVEGDQLCAWVCFLCRCCWLVASVVGVVFHCSLVACAVQVLAGVLVGVAGFVFHASSCAQVRGPCWQTRVLPRGDDLAPAKEKVWNVIPPFPLDPGCDVLPVVFHGS